MSQLYCGYDIGGTKCAVVIGKRLADGTIEVLGKSKLATAEQTSPRACLENLTTLLRNNLQTLGLTFSDIKGIGVSCGGPLDSVLGLIQSPPNLPGWDDIPVVKWLSDWTGCDCKLENDANACGLAEWQFGAGRGTSNMIFLTFGTGLGAGIIANGALLRGQNGMGGEVGHIRLAPNGPIGYGKAGSFEGFCSGGGLAQLGQLRARKLIAAGKAPVWCPNEAALNTVTAKSLAEAAFAGDTDAIAVYRLCGRRLGQGLSILVDILNPEVIILGSVFLRSERLLRSEMEKVMSRECLSYSLNVCRVVPSGLGESIGDVASLAVAL